MATYSAPGIPLKMYRRFAVVTVLFTAAIAMLADGGKREAVASQLEAQPAETDDEGTDRAVLIRRDSSQKQSRFDYTDQSDIDMDFGAPMIEPSPGGNSGIVPRSTRQSAIPGYSQEYLDSLSEEEYRRLVESLRDEGMLDPRERQRNIRSLEAASRRRSGAGAAE